MLRDYFKAGRYESALDAYAKFAKRQDWRMSYRAELYGYAQDALNLSLSLEQRQVAFEEVYDGLNRYFRVFRNSTGGHWDSDQIFSILTESCKSASRGSGPNLASLQTAKDVNAVEDAIVDIAGIKTIREYPYMVASKFLHFFNPHLFPIYDGKIMWDEVLCGPFKSEWQNVCNRTGIKFRETTGAFNVSYTRWAAANIQVADASAMPYFAEWFRQQSQIKHDDLPSLDTYYATAFEFIAIGATEIITVGI